MYVGNHMTRNDILCNSDIFLVQLATAGFRSLLQNSPLTFD